VQPLAPAANPPPDMKPYLYTALLLLSALPARAESPLSALWVEYEAGPAAVFQLDGRYGPTGTRYDADTLNQRANLYPSQRLALEARLGQRHSLIFLYAPLDLSTRAALRRDIDFRGTLFREGVVVDSRFLFDGYRASYLYRVVDDERLSWDVGASFQVRNAEVNFSAVDGSLHAAEYDIGLVFAVKTRLLYRFPWRLWAALEADALSTFGLVGPLGGIYDVALTLGVPLTARSDVSAYLRLRALGGGAEVTRRDIYNWGHFGFALVGVQADLVSLLNHR
jgi:hypothetical protein